jgi:aspartate kinase
MKVIKFGGTSLADAKQLGKVLSIVQADPTRRIVVVSAPGKRFKDDTKVTDLLIALAEAALAGSPTEGPLQAVLARFASIRTEAGLPAELMTEIETDLRARVAADRTHRGRFMDSLKAAGEDYSARITAAFFRRNGVAAEYVNPGAAGLLLSDDFGNAMVLEESYARLASLRDRPGVVIFPGFFGITRQGHVATFPRGGSDITGAILAAAVKADVYENFTDVDSVFAMDPRIVPGAPAIGLITYREMRELAYAGFGVFHDEAIVPAVRARIPINIRNTNRPEAPGTMIVPERPYDSGEVAGIASADGFCAIYIDKYLMNREVGFGRRLLQILEEEGVSFEHTPSGIDSLSVIVRDRELTAEREKRITERIQAELKPDAILVEHGLALIMIVGEGMHYTVGMASRATAALSQAGVNIEMMNQGSSEISMMFGVKAADRVRAAEALYRTFFIPKSAT